MKTKLNFQKIFHIAVLMLMMNTVNIFSQWQQTSLGWGETYNGAVSGSYVYIGTYGAGIYVSSDRGETWSQKGLQNIAEISSTAAAGKYAFAGTTNGLIFRSTDNGDTWNQVFSANQNVGFYKIAVNGNYVYAGCDNGLYRSIDGGLNWEFVTQCPATGIVEIAVNGSNIYLGQFDNMGIWKSSDNGSTWQQTLSSKYVYSIAVRGEHIFAGTDFDGLFYSSDNGVTWSQTSLDATFIMSVAVRGNNIFVTNLDFNTFDGYVYRSTNNGKDWTEWNDGFGSMFFTIIYPILITGDQALVVTHPHSVWKRSIYSNSMLPEQIVTNNKMDVTAGRKDLNLKFKGRDIGQFKKSSFIKNELSHEQIILSNNYPNPFNPSTKISYILPGSSNVKLTIYNSIGQTVAELVNTVQSAGRHEVEWNASAIPSGMYFYRLEAGDFKETKKMLLIK